jgi:UDP-GlcNAc:undecaprenyl-phosphate/decaprenyl-phosphate GlcNAc-1-phosphate transferase
MIYGPVFSSAIAALLSGLVIHRVGIPFARHFGLLDVPNPRRRHTKPTPIIGGLCIFLSAAIGLAVYVAQNPTFWNQNRISLLTLGTSVLILAIVGIIDDVKGLGPAPKIGFQLLAAIICMAFEPHVHQFGLNWQGIFVSALHPMGLDVLGAVVWPLGAVWLVGITNAINLIDGLDGLAGGTSLMVCASILILGASHGADSFPAVIMALLVPAIFSFLTVNWSPARMFLGDNGSLTLGFIIASASLMCQPTFNPSTSWVTPFTVLLMTGYPILDMGLAVKRRYKNRLPLFKADRNHLHYRIQRLGLDVQQTAMLLLCISFYLQVAALCLNFVTPVIALVGIALSFCSIFSLLYVVRSIERARVNQISAIHSTSLDLTRFEPAVLHIELSPLYEVGLFEEKERCTHLINSLEAIVRTMIGSHDELIRDRDRISVVLNGSMDSEETRNAIQTRFSKKLKAFSELVDLQTSLSSLPISVTRRRFEPKFEPKPSQLNC